MNVMAAIVTYQPDTKELEDSVAAIRAQVDSLLLIDNASSEPFRIALRDIASRYQCEFQENTRNLGIATALNQAVEQAIAWNAAFILFFDQDSTSSPDFVEQELLCYRTTSATARVGLVTPQIVNRVTGEYGGPLRDSQGVPLFAQTSGALMPVSVFQDAGLFRDDMFIDYVDYEHCLRMRLKGWAISFAENATLLHLPGKNVPVRRFGYMKYVANASVIRHYYSVRNCVWLAIHYFRRFPRPVYRLCWSLARERTKVLLFEDNRWQKVTAWVKGFRDGLRGRLGARTA